VIIASPWRSVPTGPEERSGRFRLGCRPRKDALRPVVFRNFKCMFGKCGFVLQRDHPYGIAERRPSCSNYPLRQEEVVDT